MKIFLICISLFTVGFSSSFANEKEIGRVVKVVGTVLRENLDLKLKEEITAGASIYEKDELNSGPSSYLKILMNDDTIHQIGPNTQFKFEQFKMQTKENRKAIYNVLKGQVRSLFSVKAEDEESLTIKTPTSSMGIRGTEPIVEVFQIEETKEMMSRFAILSGKVNIQTNGKASILEKGDFFDSKKLAIEKITPKEFSRLAQKGGLIFFNEIRPPQQKIIARNERFEELRKVVLPIVPGPKNGGPEVPPHKFDKRNDGQPGPKERPQTDKPIRPDDNAKAGLPYVKPPLFNSPPPPMPPPPRTGTMVGAPTPGAILQPKPIYPPPTNLPPPPTPAPLPR